MSTHTPPVSTHTPPADLYRHSLRLLLDRNIPARVGLWAEDGIMEFPFAPQGWSDRLPSYRDYWNPLAVLEPGTDFAGSTR